TYEWDKIEQEYHLISRDRKLFINRTGLNSVIGFEKEIYEKLVLDIYVGLGVRYSHIKSDSDLSKFNDSWLGYGYSGTLGLAGIRVGVNL
ncbi:hypothetical protein MEO93_28945, partial [Dolichospermum sp. ST_sed3]|nr:hypothetical protein [Dolichospermum sp. ST_sed3]